MRKEEGEEGCCRSSNATFNIQPPTNLGMTSPPMASVLTTLRVGSLGSVNGGHFLEQCPHPSSSTQHPPSLIPYTLCPLSLFSYPPISIILHSAPTTTYTLIPPLLTLEYVGSCPKCQPQPY